MIPLVVDASVATAYVLKSQRSPATVALFDDWLSYAPCAPYVFSLEMPWVLLKQERRSKELGLATSALQRLEDLRVDIDAPPDAADLDRAFILASDRAFGFYDAFYVMLAAQRDAALATRDAAQAAVAHSLGVEVLDVR